MIFLATLEYAILAATFTLGKIAVGLANPLFLIGIRMTVSSPILLFIHYIKDRKFNIDKKDFNLIFLIGIFHIFLPFVCEFWSLQYLSSAKTAIIYSLTPFIAAILSFFIFRTKLAFSQILGLFVGLLGLSFIFLSGDEVEYKAGELFHISVPELVLLISVISASYAWFLITRLMSKGYSITLINGLSMLIGGILSFLMWILFYSHEPPLTKSVNEFIFWTGLLILTANIISYNFYGWLLKHISITFMSMLGFLCPIFASFYGWYFLDEEITMAHFLALLMVILGLWLFYRVEYAKKTKKISGQYG